MVSMNDPKNGALKPLLSTHMQALVQRIETSNTPGDLDGLFAYHIIENVSSFPLTWNVKSSPEDWLDKNSKHLGNYPVLSAAGYLLTHFPYSMTLALQKAFTDSLAKLRLRDPFPDDRVSFAYQPRAFLGIALGVHFLNEVDGAYRSWLIELLADKRCQSAAPYYTFLYHYIRHVLTQESQLIADIEQYTSLRDLAMLEWGVRHKALRLPDAHTELSSLPAKLLEICLLEDISMLDSSQAAVIWSAVYSSLTRMFSGYDIAQSVQNGFSDQKPVRTKEVVMDKVKVLFLAANPLGTDRLKLDEELRAIAEKVYASAYREHLQIESSWATRPDDLLQSLNRYRPHIVHFSGHGSPTGELILVDNTGLPKAIPAIALKALFTTLKDNIQVVILNACYSKVQAAAITEVINCVVGMNDSIGDEAAIIFAASFYRALGFGRSVKEAFEQGKVALLLEGIPEENTPELLNKAGINASEVFLVKRSGEK